MGYFTTPWETNLSYIYKLLGIPQNFYTLVFRNQEILGTKQCRGKKNHLFFFKKQMDK